MKPFHTIAIGMAVGNILLGIQHADATRVSTFAVLLCLLVATRGWCE